MLRSPALKGRSGGPAANRSATVGGAVLSRPQGRVFTPLRSYEGQWLRGRRLAPQTGRLRPGHSPCVTSVTDIGSLSDLPLQCRPAPKGKMLRD